MNASEAREFELFVATSGDRLLRAAVLLTGDLGHAEDLVQVTLERTARRWKRLEGSPEAFARVVLARLATDRWRERRRRPERFASEEEHLPDGYDVAHHVVSRQTLLAGLRTLPPRQRGVLVLRFLLDLSEAETAEALGVSLGTVKSSASRGVARLREAVPELDPRFSETLTTLAEPGEEQLR